MAPVPNLIESNHQDQQAQEELKVADVSTSTRFKNQQVVNKMNNKNIQWVEQPIEEVDQRQEE